MAHNGTPAAFHARTAQLAMFIRGRLPSDRASVVCEHVLVCNACQEEVQEITALLWPSLSIWIKCWLRVFSPSWPPSRVMAFIGGSVGYFRRSAVSRLRAFGQRPSGV